jgi:hypothetical protein
MQKNTYRFKQGVGRHHGKRGKIYNAGDLIELYEWETAGFMDKLELLPPAVPAPAQVTAPPLEIHPAEDGKFNIINPKTGVALNSVPLSEAQARVMAGPDATVFIPSPPVGPPVTRRVRKPVVGVTEVTVADQGPRKLTSLHKGAGRYVVLDETTGQLVAGGDGQYLSKAEADAMVEKG